MALTLYKLDASPPARAAMMTIEALGLHNVKYVDVNILAKEQFSEAYTKINPQHTVPTLKDGDFVIWDSHAIAAYLVSKYGKDDSLYPTDLKKRAIIDQRLHFDTGILFPAIRGTVTLLLMGNTTVKEENLQQIESAYDFTEKFLDKEWIAGDQFTIADICCVASISSLKAFLPIDSEKYPRLNSWLERCSELEIYEKANAPGVKSFSYFVKSKMA